jgi:hypothetical protein
MLLRRLKSVVRLKEQCRENGKFLRVETPMQRSTPILLIGLGNRCIPCNIKWIRDRIKKRRKKVYKWVYREEGQTIGIV